MMINTEEFSEQSTAMTTFYFQTANAEFSAAKVAGGDACASRMIGARGDDPFFD
ncbi:MAG: hypothetical protein ACTSYB_16345 [Candidatus Helarchaeota archaeon]